MRNPELKDGLKCLIDIRDAAVHLWYDGVDGVKSLTRGFTHTASNAGCQGSKRVEYSVRSDLCM